MSLTTPRAAQRLRAPAPSRESFKPRGLWVSDDDCEENWREWCIGERFCLERLTHVHDVELVPDADVLILRSAFEIDAFTKEWRCDEGVLRDYALRWPDVQARYAGLIITPYIWARRLDGGADWYYGWDCASGCIWNPVAIASVTLREIVPVPEPVS
jgi:hypothetical protein